MTTDSDRISRIEGIIEQISLRLTALEAGQESIRTEMRESIGSLRTEMRESIGSLRTEMSDSIGSLRTEMRESIGSLRTEMSDSIGGLRTETHESFGSLRAEMQNQTRMVLLTVVGASGAVFAGMCAAVVTFILQT